MSSNLRNKLFSFSAAAVICAALQSGAMSGQILSSSGSDNNTRLLIRGTDSSIALWVLNPLQDILTIKGYGPYLGYEPLAIATGADNYSRVLWKYTDGSIVIWVVDPNLNYVTQKVYGPYPTWNPLTISTKPNGQLSVLWKRTDGVLAVWLVDSSLNIVLDKHYGPFPTYDPQAGATGVKAEAAQNAKAPGDIRNPVPDNDRD